MHSPSAALVWSPCQSTRLMEMKTIKTTRWDLGKATSSPGRQGKAPWGRGCSEKVTATVK